MDEIAHVLNVEHSYVAELEGRPLQRVVDMRWAMWTAGRKLGVAVVIDESRVGGHVRLVASIRRDEPQ